MSPDTPAEPDQVKPRTYLINDPEAVEQLLLQNKVWPSGGQQIPISELKRDHLENIVRWMDTQVAYILQMFRVDTEPLSLEAMHGWLHQQPLMRALDAALVHRRRMDEAQPPSGLEPSGWLLGPMLALDIETTGVDLEEDRIVSFALGVAEEPGKWESITELVNPGMPIPPEASEIHKITDADVADRPTIEQFLPGIVRAIKEFGRLGAPVIAHNARFDLTILDRECRRHTGQGLPVGWVVDTMVIDKGIDTFRKGRRTLDAACEHYGVGVQINHSADEDAMRALRLAWKIATSPKFKETFGEMPTLGQLHQWQVERYAEQAAHMAQWRSKTGQHPGLTDLTWPIARQQLTTGE